jgi:hypothetical protein
MTSIINTLLYGIIITSQEPTLPLRLNEVWGLTSTQVGLSARGYLTLMELLLTAL